MGSVNLDESQVFESPCSDPDLSLHLRAACPAQCDACLLIDAHAICSGFSLLEARLPADKLSSMRHGGVRCLAAEANHQLQDSLLYCQLAPRGWLVLVLSTQGKASAQHVSVLQQCIPAAFWKNEDLEAEIR